ncbi:Aste57867_23134 [Aphanomyces stellatus]|uniref:Aste57867_23134 protein n=1 Tax=Aphanomyces stellatus TaxID=120398 RepID=A0A485LLY3_9STRA|nr:hypothetical protein As57867_023063 [Aphanomyces stellatus]VFT99782.1 Aste57867_23134 [Aphanomyces stellatus]
MDGEAKWNWKELCTIKEEKVERSAIATSAIGSAKTGKSAMAVTTVASSHPALQPVVPDVQAVWKKKRKAPRHDGQPPKLNAEQKRAMSHAIFGVGPSRTQLQQDPDAHHAAEREKFRIYTPASGGGPSIPKAPSTIESFSSLRIKDRLVSADEMRDQMEGRKFIPLSALEKTPMRELESQDVDWVTIAVVSKKTMGKAEHSPYVVWTLSDLDNAMISVFLYGGAYDDHWKELEGSIVALINPMVMPAKEKGKFSLRVTLGFHVVKLGTALDFGFCKSLTHGGSRCKIPINMANGDYCVIHMAAKFKEAGKGRQALNGAGTFRADLFRGGDGVRNISAGSYAQPGRPRAAVPAKRKRPDMFTALKTTVDAHGNVALPTTESGFQSKLKPTDTAAGPAIVRLADKSASLAELRQSIDGKKNAAPGQKNVIAKILGVGGPAKKINMMALMMKTTTATGIATSATNPLPLSTPSTSRPSTAPLLRMEPPSRAVNVTSLRASGLLANDPTPSISRRGQAAMLASVPGVVATKTSDPPASSSSRRVTSLRATGFSPE